MAAELTCASCFFWVADPHGGYGECRRDGPHMGANGYAEWPRTRPADWCGEHAQVISEADQVPADA